MNVLIVSEYIAPAAAIASIRWTKLGKYLARNHGCRVDVLTNRKSYDKQPSSAEEYQYDSTLADDLRYFNVVYQLPDTFLSRTAIRLMNWAKRRKDASPVRKAAGSVDTARRKRPLQSGGMLNSSIKKALSLYEEIKDRAHVSSAENAGVDWSSYDVLISTCGPKWTHRIARIVKEANPDLIWLADYRDPLTGYASRMTEENMSFAANITTTADSIIAIADGIVEHLYLPELQRCEIVHNGYDKDDVASRERGQSSKFILSYTGALYNEPPNTRDMRPVFKALTDLISSGVINRNDVEVVYCGVSSDEFLAQAEKYPQIPTVDLGLVSRKEAKHLQDVSSLLIFCTWNTEYSKGALTGKLYEYLSAGVPLVAVCSGEFSGHESTKIIREANVGVAYEEATCSRDYAQLVDFLAKKYNEWVQYGVTSCDSNWDYIETFEYGALASKVCSLIEDIRLKRTMP